MPPFFSPLAHTLQNPNNKTFFPRFLISANIVNFVNEKAMISPLQERKKSSSSRQTGQVHYKKSQSKKVVEIEIYFN